MHLHTRWPELLPDLLRQISGRLHHAVDFVSFHAVCRPWRNSYDAKATAKTTQQFLPWLLTTIRNKKHYNELRLKCVFSKTSNSTVVPVPVSNYVMNWVANTQGTAIGYLGDRSLHNPLTGATTPVPTIQEDGIDDWINYSRPNGVVYRDGTILLYSKNQIINQHEGGGATWFTAALRRPGDDVAWSVVERTLDGFVYGNFCIAYHGGNILVSAEARQRWHVVTPNDNNIASDVLIPSPLYPTKRKRYYKYCHVMESCGGELLWASLHVPNNLNESDICNVVQALSLSVYTLQEEEEEEEKEEEEEEVSAPKKMRWVRKDNLSLAKLVLFLGGPYSFAVDASRLGGGGGCAYFVYTGSNGTSLYDWSAVFRYNLVDNKAEFVESLPQDWHDDKCAWLVPQPTIIAVMPVTTM